MRLRVAVYCEGAGEGSGERTRLPAPGSSLDQEHLGAAHRLVERCLCEGSGRASLDINFVAPALLRARTARGSDLLNEKSLRKLVNALDTDRSPHLSVVLVDSDGEFQRKTQLKRALEAEPPILLRYIVGVAHQCFEAWLLGDVSALKDLASCAIEATPSPENLPPAEAKRQLGAVVALARTNRKDHEVSESALRSELATTVSLNQLRRQRSFEDFMSDCAMETRAFLARSVS